LLAVSAASAEKVYLLKWQGGRVPRGAQVGGFIIEWTQGGMVVDEQSKTIATYERIVDHIGNPPKNEMVVFLDEMAE